MAKGTRPALDIVIPVAAKTLADVVEAIADDFCPFAIEAPGDQSAPSTSGSDLLRRIYFSRDSDCHAAARAITDTLGHAGVTAHPVDVLDDGADWAARAQEDLRAVRVGNIVVAPPWDAISQTPDASVIVIRPSIGFGTGHHASTRLCLHALQAQPVHGVAVTDLGTGSGVLAIAATRLGARSVVAIEHDSDVAASALENFAANDVADAVRLLQADITTTTPSPPAEIVVANLTGAVLRRLARCVAAYAVTGGTLILGGLTNDEEVEVLDAFAPLARPEESTREEEWSCLTLKTLGQGTSGIRGRETRGDPGREALDR